MSSATTPAPKQASKAGVIYTVADLRVTVDGKRVCIKDVPAVLTKRHDGPLFDLPLVAHLKTVLSSKGVRTGATYRYSALVRGLELAGA
jgi:hypothetical protein